MGFAGTTSNASAMDIVFYESEQFPTEYKGDAFVAFKGSWNRSEPTGYKVVRVPFKDGKPQGYYQNFVTGFWVSGESRAEVWGRPTALAVAKDGALLIGDDTGARFGGSLTTGRSSRRASQPTRPAKPRSKLPFTFGRNSTKGRNQQEQTADQRLICGRVFADVR